MTEKTLRLASAGFALIGAAITAYLLYARWTGGTLACTTGGCETVQPIGWSRSHSALLSVSSISGRVTGAIGAPARQTRQVPSGP